MGKKGKSPKKRASLPARNNRRNSKNVDKKGNKPATDIIASDYDGQSETSPQGVTKDNGMDAKNDLSVDKGFKDINGKKSPKKRPSLSIRDSR